MASVGTMLLSQLVELVMSAYGGGDPDDVSAANGGGDTPAEM